MKKKTIIYGKFHPVIVNDFEVASRNMRWAAIIGVVLLFPIVFPQVLFAYAVAAVAAIFNLTRYSTAFMRHRWYASGTTIVIADFAYAVAIALCTGKPDSPFGILMFVAIISAAYVHKLKGTLTVVILQMVIVYYIYRYEASLTAVDFGTVRQLLASLAVSIGFGLFIERVTRIQRDEASTMVRLSTENDTQRKQLKALVDSLQDIIFVVDAKGTILDCNAAARSLIGLHSTVIGTTIQSSLKLHPRTNFSSKAVDLLKEEGHQHRRDLSFKSSEGAVLDLDISVQPVHIESDTTTHYIIVCKDITKEHSLDEQRSSFISVASHELRTPIAIMEAALSAAMLSKDKMDKPTFDTIKTAHDHSLFLASIVRDLSILAQASNDNIPIEIQKIDIGRLVRQMIFDFTAPAEQKGVKLKVEIDEDIPEVLSTENHIREILQNYLTNALKYTEKGSVHVSVDSSDKGGVVISVADSGIGISPADQKNLFKKFFRSEDFRTQQTGGTGLGLYLCMEIAQRINAKVWCESQLNKGSIFYLEVPPVTYLQRDQKEVVKAEVANLIDDI